MKHRNHYSKATGREYNPATIVVVSVFGTLLAFVIMGRTFPRRFQYRHRDKDGNPVDPSTGLPLRRGSEHVVTEGRVRFG